MNWNACVAVPSLWASSASSIVDKVTYVAASHSHVSDTGNASLFHTQDIDVAPAQTPASNFCLTAQRRVEMHETKLDELKSTCGLRQTSSKHSAYI